MMRFFSSGHSEKKGGKKEILEFITKRLTVIVLLLMLTTQVCGTGDKTVLPKEQHRQSRKGIIVQIEKVVIERILNEPGYMDRENPHWEKIDFTHPGESWRSFRFICIFISFGGEVETIDFIEQPKVTFAIKSMRHSEGIVQLQPPMLAQRLPCISIARNAWGIEYRAHIGKNDDPLKLFPISIMQNVRLKNGQTITFMFEDVSI